MRCDRCGITFDRSELVSDEAGLWCEECDTRNRKESLESVGGEALIRAEVALNRNAREHGEGE